MRLKIHQWQFGPMLNHQYCIADEDAGKAAITDPGFDAAAILATVEGLDLTLDKIILTHTHGDHIGALDELLGLCPVPVYVHEDEAARVTVDDALLRTCADGEVIHVGDVRVDCLHTPGHTPGGMCLLIDGHLITGDTLFIGACGRTDLPGGDARVLWDSIHTKLGPLPDETFVLPGHHYANPYVSTIGAEKHVNPALRAASADEFARWMNGAG